MDDRREPSDSMGPVWLYNVDLPVRLLPRDELLQTIRRWQSPSAWDCAFSLADQFDRKSRQLDEISIVHAESKDPELYEKLERIYLGVTEYLERAKQTTGQIRLVKHTIRETAPEILFYVPVVSFYSGVHGDSSHLARQMMELEGQFLAYERNRTTLENHFSVGGSEQQAAADARNDKKTKTCPHGQIVGETREQKELLKLLKSPDVDSLGIMACCELAAYRAWKKPLFPSREETGRAKERIYRWWKRETEAIEAGQNQSLD